MRTVYTVPITGETVLMNTRLAHFITEHMNKPLFETQCVARYEKAVVCQQRGRIVGCALLRKLPPDATNDHADLLQNPACIFQRGEGASTNCGSGRESEAWERAKLERHIECVCVHRDYRNQGVGSEVMHAAIAEWRNERHLSTDEAEDIVLWIDHKQNRCDLLRFYERLNFKVALDRGADSKLILSS